MKEQSPDQNYPENIRVNIKRLPRADYWEHKITEAGNSVSLVLPTGADVTAVIFDNETLALSTSEDVRPIVTLDQLNSFHGAIVALFIKETKKRGQENG